MLDKLKEFFRNLKIRSTCCNSDITVEVSPGGVVHIEEKTHKIAVDIETQTKPETEEVKKE